jgi:hypothetical protein
VAVVGAAYKSITLAVMIITTVREDDASCFCCSCCLAKQNVIFIVVLCWMWVVVYLLTRVRCPCHCLLLRQDEETWLVRGIKALRRELCTEQYVVTTLIVDTSQQWKKAGEDSIPPVVVPVPNSFTNPLVQHVYDVATVCHARCMPAMPSIPVGLL